MQRSREAALILKRVRAGAARLPRAQRDGSRVLLEVTSVFIDYEGSPRR